ncbi:MAG: FG-GAP repeat protein [Myxococcales bacterium]|nr:FG-GAP repeat protein [Myxococcales bacterium]
MWWAFGSVVVGFVGCSGGVDDTQEPVRPSPSCLETLAIEIERPAVPVLGGTTFRATGGSGQVRFELVSNASGGLVQPETGVYVAGAGLGIDVVAAHDEVCGAAVQAEVEVVPRLAVEPMQALVRPTAQITFADVGAASVLACTMLTDATGGTLQRCTWTAGVTNGIDEIEVTSPATGESVVARMSVRADARMRLQGGRLFLPVGHPFEVSFTAGTQLVEMSTEEGLEVVDNRLLGVAEGRYTVVARDRYVPTMSAEFQVDVAEARVHQAQRDGEHALWGEIRSADIDGDGSLDAVLGSPEVSMGAHFSGVVHVYAGSGDELDEVPVSSFTLPQQYASSGRGLALGDVDADGQIDLAVGANGWNEPNSPDHGRIDVYRGIAGGFFESDPTWTVLGEFAGDQVGWDVEICDVDGDGLADLVGTAVGSEDRSENPLRSGEGGLVVWRGTAQGPALAPTWRAFSGRAGALVGYKLAAGDVDGDAQCDLLATSIVNNLDGVGQDGSAFLFLGATLTGPAPVQVDRIYTSDEADTYMQAGRGVDLADVDGDGADDVILGAWHAAGSSEANGAVWIWLEADHAGEPKGAVVTSQVAHATLRGTSGYDYLGYALEFADGALWVSAPSAEDPGDPGDAGIVYRVPAADLVGERVMQDVAERWSSPSASAFHGAALGVVGERALAYASRDDAFAVDAGAVYELARGGRAAQRYFPGVAAGAHLGETSAVGWFDPDGDGAPDLVAGAWGEPSATSFNVGVGLRFAALADRWDGSVTQRLEQLPGVGSGDRLGRAISSAGDFDGDGQEDLVVVAMDDDRPGSFGTAYANPAECPGGLNASGAAHIFRGAESSPSFVVFGAAASDRFEGVAGGFDHDGDGLSDVILGSTAAGLEGGFTLVHGRPADPGQIQVICDAVHVLGVSNFSRMGGAVSAAGDIDGDGCDEIAVGADADDLGRGNQGSVRILWGAGPGCATSTLEVTTLVSGVANHRMGSAVDGGHDVDGDGVVDVVIGGRFAQEGGVEVGAAWLASGAWIASRSRQPAIPLPADGATVAHVVPTANRLLGTELDGELGVAVALVPDPADDTRAWMAVGQHTGSLGGATRAGGVWMYQWEDRALDPQPVGTVGGESPESRMGAALSADWRGPVLAVGAPLSDEGGLDSGAVYPFRLDPN